MSRAERAPNRKDQPNEPTGNQARDRVAALRALVRGQYREALKLARSVLAKDKRDWEMHRVAGASLTNMRRLDEGLAHLEEAIRLAPHEPLVVCGLANARRIRGETAAARELLERVFKTDPTHAVALQLKASMYRAEGNEAAALETLRPALEADEIDDAVVVAYADACIATKDHEPAIPIVERALAGGKSNPTHLESLHNRLAQLYDAVGRYDEAWQQLRKQHTATPTKPDITDPRPYLHYWTKDRIQKLPRAERSAERSLLIVGMPRSGTTLTESIIAAHPEGSGIGESPLLGRFAHEVHQGKADAYAIEQMSKTYHAELDHASDERTRVVADKMPGNIFLLHVAWAVLPGCRVVRCQRDPRDVLVSCMFQSFRNRHTYIRDPLACATQIVASELVYRRWREILDIPMMDLHYRDTTRDTENAVRRLLDHAGLGYHEDALKFNESKRRVQTASMAQVRRPIYTSSLARWKRYEKHLGPAIERLREHGLLEGEDE